MYTCTLLVKVYTLYIIAVSPTLQRYSSVEVGQKEKGFKVFCRTYQKFKVYRYSTESNLSFLIIFLDNTLYRRVLDVL